MIISATIRPDGTLDVTERIERTGGQAMFKAFGSDAIEHEQGIGGLSYEEAPRHVTDPAEIRRIRAELGI